MESQQNYMRLKSLFGENADHREVEAILERNHQIAEMERKFINTLTREQLVEEYISSSEYHLTKQSIAYNQLLDMSRELAQKSDEIDALKEQIEEMRKQMPKAFKDVVR